LIENYNVLAIPFYLKNIAPTKIINIEKHAMYSHVKFSVNADFHSGNGTWSPITMQTLMNNHINPNDANVTTGLHLICPKIGILKCIHKLSS
jgi:hypothetical protein